MEKVRERIDLYVENPNEGRVERREEGLERGEEKGVEKKALTLSGPLRWEGNRLKFTVYFWDAITHALQKLFRWHSASDLVVADIGARLVKVLPSSFLHISLPCILFP